MHAMFLVVHVALLMALRLSQYGVCCYYLMRIEDGSTNNKGTSTVVSLIGLCMWRR
jgi:hypothetical protein